MKIANYLFIFLLIAMQFTYYWYVLQEQFLLGYSDYNVVSILSISIFMIMYLYKINFFKMFKYGARYTFLNFYVGMMIPLVVLVVIFVCTMFSVFGTSIVYGVINGTFFNFHYKYPLIVSILKYNLVFYNFVIIAIHIIYDVVKAYTNHKDKIFKLIHKILTYIIIIAFIYLGIMNLNLFYYLIYYIVSFLIIWLSIPILFNLCRDYYYYFGILIGTSIIVYVLTIVFNILYNVEHPIYL